jgi:hypothetical protein
MHLLVRWRKLLWKVLKVAFAISFPTLMVTVTSSELTANSSLDANAALTNNSADMMDRRVVVSPTTNAKTTKSLQGLLNPATEISAQFRSGQMKSGLGLVVGLRIRLLSIMCPVLMTAPHLLLLMVLIKLVHAITVQCFEWYL